MKLGLTDLNFREKRHREVRTFLTGVNEMAFTGVS
jgi:hypothetical protein